MAGAGNERFNAEAAAWDTNPDVHRASDGARDAILEAFPQLKDLGEKGTAANDGLEILEIGSGTGLLSFRIAPYVRSILAVDASYGMVSALEQKLAASAKDTPRNIQPLCIMLTDPENPALPPAGSASPDSTTAPRRKFDLILSHLVLHHIADLKSLLRTMYGCLKSGGHVALTDFEDFGPEAKRFHPASKMEGVERHGVQRVWFAGVMREVGFVDVSVAAAWTMRKGVERWEGEWAQGRPEMVDEMDFPFLLCRGRKP